MQNWGRAAWISFYFLPRAACAVDQFLFFTARSLHGGNHVLLLSRSAARARCWILIRPPRRACAAADLTGQHRADPTRRTFCRAGPVMKFVF
jgi:hypothetical protein